MKDPGRGASQTSEPDDAQRLSGQGGAEIGLPEACFQARVVGCNIPRDSHDHGHDVLNGAFNGVLAGGLGVNCCGDGDAPCLESVEIQGQVATALCQEKL